MTIATLYKSTLEIYLRDVGLGVDATLIDICNVWTFYAHHVYGLPVDDGKTVRRLLVFGYVDGNVVGDRRDGTLD